MALVELAGPPGLSPHAPGRWRQRPQRPGMRRPRPVRQMRRPLPVGMTRPWRDPRGLAGLDGTAPAPVGLVARAIPKELPPTVNVDVSKIPEPGSGMQPIALKKPWYSRVFDVVQDVANGVADGARSIGGSAVKTYDAATRAKIEVATQRDAIERAQDRFDRASESWFDQEMIPGLQNKWLAVGAAGAAVLLFVALKRKEA